ncbi:MAG: TonB family protein [Terracidiphilus sp.]
MQSPDEPTKRRLPPVLLSIVCHIVLFACVILLQVSSKVKVVPPTRFEAVAKIENAGGSHAVKLKLPNLPFAAHTREPDPDAEATKKTILPVEQTQFLKRSGGGAPAKPHTGDGFNKALRGNGTDAEDARPAFPIFSPRPPVTDRSLLPDSEKKIVVDVNVDASGQVVSESLVKGIGNRLDQIVLDIVKSWRFQPATVNGKPVPTQAELIFPFNPSYPITDS